MEIIKKIIPHLIVFLMLILTSYTFFAPAAFDGKVLRQHDNVQAQGMATELKEVYKETGHSPLWTNAAFGGMPAFQIWIVSKNKIWNHIRQIMSLNKDMKAPHGLLLLAMLACYIALLLFKIDYRISAVMAICFGLITNNIIYIDAGHTIKMIAIFMALPIISGAHAIFKRKEVLGIAVTSFFLALQLSANHYQITYYTFLIIGIMAVVYVIRHVKSGGFKVELLRPLVLVAITVAIGVLSNLGRFWSTYEYAAETIRGKTHLKAQASGLDKSYAQSYSFGIAESFGLMIPGFQGGSAKYASFLEDRSSSTYGAYRKVAASIPKNQVRGVQSLTRTYWGASGTLHYGIMLSFLFILGLFLVSPLLRWTGLISMSFFLLLSWGNHFSAFNDLMFDYFPMYNKFRDPKMCLQVGQAILVCIAAMGLHRFFSSDTPTDKKRKALKFAGGGLLALLVLLLIYSFVAGLASISDDALASLPELQSALQMDRADLMRSGIFRSIGFVLIGLLILWLYLKEKLGIWPAIVGIGLLGIIDLWLIDVHHVNKDSYFKKQEVFAPRATEADKQILLDRQPYYRVFDLSRGNPFASALASNFHKSIGGYHAAKLRRFQDVVDHHILNDNRWVFNTKPGILDMLNVKYLINQNSQVTKRPNALGNAWLVDQVTLVPDADMEMAQIATIDPKVTAVVQNKYKPALSAIQLTTNNASPTDQIKLTQYGADKLSYDYNIAQERLAVFSEIYYPSSKGWKLFIDGNPMSEALLPVNYLLRGVVLPAGAHTFEMRFAPTSFLVGDQVSQIVSWIILFLLLWAVYSYSKTNQYVNLLPQISPLNKSSSKKIPRKHAKKKNRKK